MTDDLLRERQEVLVRANCRIEELERAVQWLPIGTAPKDGTKFLALMRTSNIEIAFHTDGEYGGFRVDSYAPPMINEDWMTHWMPLPIRPALEGKKGKE